jgi:hypothetical protein
MNAFFILVCFDPNSRISLVAHPLNISKTLQKVFENKGGGQPEDQYRKTLAQAFGVIILLISAGVAYKQLNENSLNAELTYMAQQLGKGLELLGKRTAARKIAKL